MTPDSLTTMWSLLMSIIAVYTISDEFSGKFYIGSTSDLTKRINVHKHQLKNDKHYNKGLQELFNANVKFKFDFVKAETLEQARAMEDMLLQSSRNNPNLLNVSTDSKGGHSEETKKYLSNKRKEYYSNFNPYIRTKENREKLSKINTGKKHTEETKKKISDNKRLWQANRSPEERKHTEETKKLLSEKHKGKIITEEQKLKMSEAKKKFLQSMTSEELKAYKDKLANSRKKKINPSL